MTNQTQATRPDRMPGTVRLAVAGLWLHTLIFGAGTAFIFLEAKSLTDHGQDGAEPLVLGGVMAAGIVAVLALSAAMTMRARQWARIVALLLEGLSLFGGLIGLLMASLVAQDAMGVVVIGLTYVALPVAIGWLLFTKQAREWIVR